MRHIRCEMLAAGLATCLIAAADSVRGEAGPSRHVMGRGHGGRLASGWGLMQVAGMSRKVRWAPNTGEFCLTGMPGGAKCLTPVRSDQSLITKENDVIVLTFSR